jgi:hypothetical protein
MAFRSFIDSAGSVWQVWDIVPMLSERRSIERRAAAAAVDREQPIPVGSERRSDERRRLSQSRRPVLSGSYATGWLCFESNRQRRRLAPIPPDWKTCTSDRIEEYAERAEPVVNARTASGARLDEPVADAG